MLAFLVSTFWCLSIAAAQNSTTAQDATVFALQYGYPLLAYEKVRIAATAVGINTWLHFRQLQGPTSVAVVKPNVETIYSAMVYDLSRNDVVVSIPDGIPKSQFVLTAFFDPFGTNYANIGSGNLDEAGQYRLQPLSGSSNGSVISFNSTNYKANIISPSIYGFVLIRWLVNNTNLDVIRQWQDATANISIPVPERAPALSTLPTQDRNSTPAANVLRLLTAFAPFTLPAERDEADRVLMTLAAAGLSNSTYTAQQGVDLEAANRTAVSAATAAASASDAVTSLSNGWTTANASLIGIFGTNTAFRSAIASGGYLALRPPNAIYPSWSNGSSKTPLGGDINLGANEAYLLTFSSTPPLIETGFWSVTAYQNNYLIANRFDIYAVTSARSNLTYSNGNLVYPRNGSATVNGTYQILVQPADISPPANWTNNFLPGPAGGGAMQITMRLYGAQQSLLDGDWQYPVVQRIAAITNGSTSTNTSTGSPSTTSAPAASRTGAASQMSTHSGWLALAAILSIVLS